MAGHWNRSLINDSNEFLDSSPQSIHSSDHASQETGCKTVEWFDLVKAEQRKQKVQSFVQDHEAKTNRENHKRYLGNSSSSDSNLPVKHRYLNSCHRDNDLRDLVIMDNLKLKVRDDVRNRAKERTEKKDIYNTGRMKLNLDNPKRKSTPELFETCTATLQRRQKQIDFGKNTLGYQNYVQEIPKMERSVEHPVTPNKRLKYSRRSWDQHIKVWRINLHTWDKSDQSASPDLGSDCILQSPDIYDGFSENEILINEEMFPQIMDVLE